MQSDVDGQAHDDNRGDEGDTPSPCDNCIGTHGGQEDCPNRCGAQGARVGAQCNQGGDNTAGLARSVLGQHDRSACNFSASTEALDQAKQHQQEGGEEANLVVGGQEADQSGCNTHHCDGDEQNLGTANTVTHTTEVPSTNRAGNVAHTVNGHCRHNGDSL